MTYTEPLANQISHFLDSVGMGFFLCTLYIAVKVIFRVFGKGKISVMLSDGIFCIFTAFISFFYMVMENNGTVRLNLALGQLLGGVLLYFSLGRLIMKILYLIADAINGVLRSVTYPLRCVLKLPLRHLKRHKKDKRNKRNKNVVKK